MRNIKQCLNMVVLLVLGACVGRADIEDLKATQTQILAKLEKLEKAPPMRAAPPPMAPQGPDPAKTYAFSVGESASHGAQDAWVTIVEVSDFQCPFCGRANNTMKEITEAYGNDVRLVFKHNPLPFHNRALPAAMAAECGREQGKFWPIHDKMFENQQALGDTELEGYAKGAGVDMSKWKGCMTEQKYKKRIEDDQNQAKNFGARGTPAFFINGRFLSGAQPLPAFKSIIDEELRKAKESKLDKKQYYAKAVEEKGDKSI